MRRIDKTEILSTKYKAWEESLVGKPHPQYNSTQGAFYLDIAMNLLYCQKGLCAYTEVQLCPLEFLNPENWEKGRYKYDIKPFNGQLEHFDEALKSKKGELLGKKDWDWDNFFVVDADTNNRKGSQAVDSILKPDLPDYNPFRLLSYNTDTHHFIANPQLTNSEKERVSAMIEVLGLNFPNLVDRRRNTVAKAIEFGTVEIENEFPTAFAFCLQAD
jgi:hypothetical protein